MTYRPRPYGLGPYGDDIYSQYHQPDLAPAMVLGRSVMMQEPLHRDVGFSPSMQARSGMRVRLLEEALLRTLILTGQSYSYANARLYWEETPACSTVWTVRPPPPFVCSELEAV
jgi:hypothetical protein